jgi:hypothetical protein
MNDEAYLDATPSKIKVLRSWGRDACPTESATVRLKKAPYDGTGPTVFPRELPRGRIVVVVAPVNAMAGVGLFALLPPVLSSSFSNQESCDGMLNRPTLAAALPVPTQSFS